MKTEGEVLTAAGNARDALKQQAETDWGLGPLPSA
jgi:hypothetical protein